MSVAKDVWDLETLNAVRGLRMEVAVEAFDSPGSWQDHLFKSGERMLRSRMVDGAAWLGAEVFPHDVMVTRYEDPEFPGMSKLTARWAPDVNEVELVGGALDGQTRGVLNIGEPLRATEDLPMFSTKFNLEEVFGYRIAVYTLAGWHEVRRRWVYALNYYEGREGA